VPGKILAVVVLAVVGAEDVLVAACADAIRAERKKRDAIRSVKRLD
jgi:hypothetical protein